MISCPAAVCEPGVPEQEKPMRKKLVAGNWKMHGTLAEAVRRLGDRPTPAKRHLSFSRPTIFRTPILLT